MIATERRLDVHLISAEALRTYMQFRGLTIRRLAKEAGCHPSTIGHLHAGTRSTCRPTTARAIAKALNAPVESLFVVRSSIVRREVAA